jgi:hypothetical protein
MYGTTNIKFKLLLYNILDNAKTLNSSDPSLTQYIIVIGQFTECMYYSPC